MAIEEQVLMERALRLAAAEHPHPNPRVGAIVVDSAGLTAGRGAHAARGAPHAEAIALAEAGERARNGTLIVTLEPCAHQGLTPACTDALLEAGVARVIVGAIDPDGRVAGRGIAALDDAGIAVVVGVPGVDAEAVDRGYFHHRRTGRPLVTVKMASTLDGQAAAGDGSSRWITSPEARRDAHVLRSRADAILIGAGTVLADDPELTVRLDGYRGDQPRPVLVAGDRPVPAAAKVLARHPLIYATRALDLPGEVIVLPGEFGVDLEAMLDDLGKRDVVDLLVEGGPTIVGALLRSGLVDRFVFYLGAALAGGRGMGPVGGEFGSVTDLREVAITGVTRVGPDLRVDAEPV